jgi:ribonuclease J
MYLSIAQPEWFVPIHGEYRHMVANAELGVIMGVARDRTLICEDGDCLVLCRESLVRDGEIPAPYVIV